MAILGIGCVESTKETLVESDDITIGALLPLTGNLDSIGESSQTALELSSEDINDYLAGLGSEKNIKLIIKDTESNPEKALEQLKNLDELGIKIVIGPQASNEAEAVLQYATENGITLMSTASTASSLAIPDDNLFRFVPDDTNQGKVLATLMNKEEINAVVPIYRNDVWGNGLSDEAKKSFEILGGTVLEGVTYETNNEDLFTEVELLNEKVIAATSEYDESSVAVLLCSYGEAKQVLTLAQTYPALTTINWYGSDGIALNKELVNDNDVASFAAAVNIKSPIYGYEEENDEYQVIESRIEEQLGRVPETYALSAYDALWIATFVDTDAVTDNDESIKMAISALTNKYFGITGWAKLDENGDRVHWDYDVWTINKVNEDYQWKLVARYQVDPGDDGKLIFVE
ncbi:ABC transporter substrate-binding protein [Methanolobus sp. ZRKC4]